MPPRPSDDPPAVPSDSRLTPLRLLRRERVEDEQGVARTSYAWWFCECACGAWCAVRGNHLATGAVRSCGCLRDDAAEGQRRPLAGLVVDELTVVDVAPAPGREVRVRCSCGREETHSRERLRDSLAYRTARGPARTYAAITCSACASSPSLVGRRFGRLVVESIDPRPYHQRRYLCRCDCGRQHLALGARLRSGFTWRCIECQREAKRSGG